MFVTFLYTLLLGIIYLVKKNWKAMHSRRRQEYFAQTKKRPNEGIKREAKPQVVIEFREEKSALREVVAELT